MRARPLVGPTCTLVLAATALLVGGLALREVKDGGSPLPGLVLLLLGISLLATGSRAARRAAQCDR